MVENYLTTYVAMHKDDLSAKFYLESTFSKEIQRNMKIFIL